MSLLRCPGKMFMQDFFILYVAEIQLPGNDIRLLSRIQSSGYSFAMAGHW
jgi:hypothetical protein